MFSEGFNGMVLTLIVIKPYCMKKPVIYLAILIAAIFCFRAHAQVSVRFNIGLQPVWGPVGYDYVDYYYIPDIDVYYNVPRHEYVYYEGGRWTYAASLPP